MIDTAFWTRLGSIHEPATGSILSGADLVTAAHARAHVLAAHLPQGEASGNIVIAHGNSADFFADLFAVWMAGGCAVCVNAGLTDGELIHIADFVAAKAILGAEAGERSGRTVLSLADGEKSALPEAAKLDDPALILFTSGTTGDPKGVVHTHRSLAARTALNAAHIGGDLSRTLCTLPTHFGHGLIGNCLSPLLAGQDLLLAPASGMELARQLGSLIDEQGITFMSSVPALWKLALRISPPPKEGRLKRVHIGSAPLSAQLWRDIFDWSGGAEVVNMYGITETANWIGGASSSDHAPQDGLIGTLWGGTAAVLTSEGHLKASGNGEILVKTPSLMQGYYKRPDLTAAAFHDGWYRTGDSGTLADDGTLQLTGRNTSMINNAGIKIYPEELDLLFERHEDVAEACAFAVPDVVTGEAVGLAVVASGPVSPDDLKAWARARIRPEAVPRHIHMVEAIPKTDRGKINRQKVRLHVMGEEAGQGQ